MSFTPSRPLAYACLALSMSLVGSYVALSKPLVAAIPVFLLAWLRFGIGGLAMLLASIGLYGVLSYSIARRTNEIGIRMALGAQSSRVLGMVLRETLFVVAVGIAVGIPAALGLTRFVSSQLYGLEASDPLTIAAACLLLAAVAMGAGWLPARRAARVDPIIALRYE